MSTNVSLSPTAAPTPELCESLMIPGPGAVIRHSYLKVIEGKIVPLALFLGFLHVAGVTGALLTALAWSLSIVAWRRATGRRISGVVVLTTIGLVAKTLIALGTGSVVVYFLQPTITTALVGLAFLVSVPLGKPLAERLAHDFCPFDAATAEHPHLQVFFLRLSLLWAFTSMLNAATTLWLLLTQPITTFVVIKSFMGPSFTAVTLLIAVLWFRRSLARQGVRLVFGSSMTMSAATPTLVPA